MKKKCIIFLLALFCLSSVYGQKNNDKETPLTTSEKIYGLSQLWAQVKYNFVFYDKLTFSWDSLYQASIPQVLNTNSNIEYYNELQKICALLKDGHTVVTYSLDLYLQNKGGLPLKTKCIEDRVFVREVLNDTLEREGIVRGTEIIKIDGMDVHDYARQYIIPYISSSTPQRLKEVAYNVDLLTGDKENPVKILFKDKQGKTFEKTLSRKMTQKDTSYAETVFEDMANSYEFFYTMLQLVENDLKGGLRFSKKGNNIGYLEIGSFIDTNKEFDECYNELKTTDALIIDIRGNIGGNSGCAEYILKYLASEPFKNSKWSSRKYVAAHASWGRTNEWEIGEPKLIEPVKDKEIYTKPVVVLTDEQTNSSAEDFCVAFRNMNRGKIIGRKTSGSTGNPIIFPIPGNGVVVICTKKDTYPDGTEFVGIGIIPDIEIKQTINDYFSNKDAILEKAMEIVK